MRAVKLSLRRLLSHKDLRFNLLHLLVEITGAVPELRDALGAYCNGRCDHTPPDQLIHTV